MASAEIARLDRRIDGVDETVRALSDSILEVREVQGEHTAAILDIREVQGEHTAAILEVREVLEHHSRTLDQHTVALTQLGEQLAEVLRRLPEPG